MLTAIHNIARRKVTWIFLLAILAAYFRTVAVLDTEVNQPLRSDAAEYYMSAHNLVHNGIYSRSLGSLANPPVAVQPDAYRPPGLPLIIAVFMGAWPNHSVVLSRVQAVNVLMGILTVILIFLAATTVLPLPAAVLTGALTAGSPHLVAMTVYLLTETPAAFFATALIGITALGVPRRTSTRPFFFLALGILVGILGMFRGAFLAFAPLLALAFVRRQDKFEALICGCLGACLIAAPWFIRGFLFVPAENSPGYATAVLLAGAYRGYMYNGIAATFPYPYLYDPQYETLQRDFGLAVTTVLAKIAEDPWGMLKWYLFEKPVFLFQWINIDGAGDVLVYPVIATPFRDDRMFVTAHWLFQQAHGYILLFAAGACVLIWLKLGQRLRPCQVSPVLRLASLLLIFHYLIHLPFTTTTRFTVPILPVIFFLAGAFVPLLWRLRQVVSPPSKQAET